MLTGSVWLNKSNSPDLNEIPPEKGCGGRIFLPSPKSSPVICLPLPDYFAGFSSKTSLRTWKQIFVNVIADICGTEPADYSIHMVAIANANGITLYNDAMNGGRDWTRWAVIHEMGHVFDFRRARFSTIPTGVWAGNVVYGIPSERMVYHVYHADEGAEDISDYAATTASEDFAESWAATLFRGNWANMNSRGKFSSTETPTRRLFIQQELEAVRTEAK